MKNAVSYIRFSSKQQASGISVSRQNDAIQTAVKNNNFNLLDIEFKDLGVSAWKGDNLTGDGSLGKFLAACKAGKLDHVDVLLVEHLDRVSRKDVSTALTFFMELLRYVDVYSMMDNRLYSSSNSELDLILAILSFSKANEESQKKSERGIKNWNKKREEPTTCTKSGTRPFWLDVSEDRKSYLLNEHIETVNQIFQMKLKKLGSQTIATRLTEEGVKTIKGANWINSSVARLLRDRRLVGEWNFNGQIIKGYYPVAIDENLFNRVQVILDETVQSGTWKGNASTQYNIFKGKGVCKECGAKLVGTKKNGYEYIQCSNALANKSCNQKLISVPMIFKFADEWLTDATLYSARMGFDKDKEEELTNRINALKVQHSLKRKGLEDLGKTGAVSEKQVEMLINTDEDLIQWHREIGILEASLLEIGSSDATYQDMQQMKKLIQDAQSGDLESRIQLKGIINTFEGLRVGSIDKVLTIELTDSEKARTFQTDRNPRVKKDVEVWHHIETVDLTE